MLNGIWVGMILLALAVGAMQGKLDAVAKAVVDSSAGAVTLALGLCGIMALFLGLMRVLQEGGLMRTVARWLRPVMVKLFPDVPADHPAMSMMILNFTANMLGLANAATPFGLKAMTELDKLNRNKGTATNAMVLFLAINTSSLALFPTGIIGLRAALGSHSPASIFVTTLIATALSTTMAIVLTKTILALTASRVVSEPGTSSADTGSTAQGASADAGLADALAMIEREHKPASGVQRALGYGFALALVGLGGLAIYGRAQEEGVSTAVRGALSDWMMLVLIAAFVIYGIVRGVKVYDAVVEGGKEAFALATRIIPYLVAILVAVGMLRASGALDLVIGALAPFTSRIGIPAETLPMVLLRPLSGSGSYAVVAETMKMHGPDSLIGTIVSTMQGSSETTFYVLAVYFGAVQVRNSRFTLLPCLVAEATGMIAAAWACRLLLF